jgi:outer membrane protein OmpA-like peptidoglycan-associated protein
MVFVTMLVGALGFSSNVFAGEHVRGVIAGHGNDGSVTVQADDATVVSVVLGDSTKIRQGRTKVSGSALLLGLHIDAEGKYETPGRFIADEVRFKKSDFLIAQALHGGLTPIDQRILANQERIEQQAKVLEQQGQTLAQQGQQLTTQGQEITSNSQKIVATTGAVAAANARIANLDDYNVISTMTVYFANNKWTVSPKYKSDLEQFAQQAKSTNGYAVEVKAYASAVGPQPRNQELSMKRADAVTSVLQQNGVILTNIVVPAAMGTSEQVASNKTSKGQAENRRAVVTLLQNKGIADR